jgi:predicted ester cyclase
MRTAESVVRVFIEEMWATGNTDLVDEVVDEHYVVDGQEGGREFVRRNMRRFRAGFPDLTVRVLHLVANEGQGTVAALFEAAGTHEGPFGGIEPTGRRMRFLEAGFFTVREGKVVAADWVSDGLGLRIHLGVLPEDFWTNPASWDIRRTDT